MGNEQSRFMRQQFEQNNYIYIQPAFPMPFKSSKVIKLSNKICLVQDLNTQDYKQTFVQVDKFLKKMNQKCPQIASFLFISESRHDEHIFFLVFEFGTQQVSNIELSHNFTKIIFTILKALVFMEKIQLFYPNITLDNIIKTTSLNGTVSYKLINQFCFKETFRFVVEYLLNVKISETKQLQLLNDMKKKSLVQLSSIISKFMMDFPSLCNPSGNLSNVSIFLDKIISLQNTLFSFEDLLIQFQILFETSQNQNKGNRNLLNKSSPINKKYSSNNLMKKLSQKYNYPKKYNSSNKRLNNELTSYKKIESNPNINKTNIKEQFRSNPVSYKTQQLNYSINNSQNVSQIDNNSIISISRPETKNFQEVSKHKKKGSKKFIIHHKKGSSGFYSMNDNRLDDLSIGVRFSENTLRVDPPRTTIQRNIQPSNDLSKNKFGEVSFKKKTKTSHNVFIDNNTNENSSSLRVNKTIDNNSSSLYTTTATTNPKDKKINQLPSRISKRSNRFTNRSTLMSQVHEEYNFHNNDVPTPKESEPPKIVPNSANNGRHFSFSKDYTIAIDPQQKEQIMKYIAKSPKESTPIKLSPEKKTFDTLRTARMSENIFSSTSKRTFNDSLTAKKASNNSNSLPKGPGLKRSSSSSFIKKENEELKKKQMKRSIYNLQRREKNDGVKKYGPVQSEQFKLKTHTKNILSEPDNQFAPRYLDFGDCPGYSYRITVVKSDNNALADKRFFNNPRNFYPPEMLINLNTCNQKIKSNISGQLIDGLKTTQMNEITQLRMKSIYHDFESLVNFKSNLKSSVYHNLQELEDNFDLTEPVKEVEPNKPFTLDDKKIEKIDNVTFKMQGIEFKDLRGQKNINIEELKKQLNEPKKVRYTADNQNKYQGRVIKRNIPSTNQIKRVNPQRQLKSVDLRSKYKTESNIVSQRNNFTNYNNTSINFYNSNKPDYKLNNYTSNNIIRKNISNRVLKKNGIGTSNTSNTYRSILNKNTYNSSNANKYTNYSSYLTENGISLISTLMLRNEIYSE